MTDQTLSITDMLDDENEAERMTLPEFLDARPSITIKFTSIPARPDGLMMEGDQKMRAHYIYVLTREASMAEPKERTMTGFYSCGSWQAFMPKRYQGFGTTEERGAKVRATPKLVDLFACLVSDAQGTDGATFEQWASDYGYDTDSRSAERTFIACQQTAKELREFLGREDYNFLMNEVEQY